MIIFNKILLVIISFAIAMTTGTSIRAKELWVDEALVFAEYLKTAESLNTNRSIDDIHAELSSFTPLKRLEAYQQLSFLKLFDLRVSDYQSFKEQYHPLLLKHGKDSHRDIQKTLDILEIALSPQGLDSAIVSISDLIKSKVLEDEAQALAHVVHIYSLNLKRNIPGALNALRQAKNSYVTSQKTKFASLALELTAAYTYQQIQDYAKSTRSYKLAVEAIESLDYLYFNVDNYLSNFSWMLRQIDELESALNINTWQLEKLTSDDSQYHLFFVYFACAVYTQIGGDFERSFECFQLAEKYLQYAPERWEQWNAGFITAALMTNRTELAKDYHARFLSDPRTKEQLSELSRMQLAKVYLDIVEGKPKSAIKRLNRYFINNSNRQMASFRSLSMQYNTYLDSEIEALERNVSLQNRLLRHQTILNFIGVVIIIGFILFTIFLLKSKRKQKILATHDSLTKLYNRRGFLETLSKSLDKSAQESKSLVLGVLDIDRFKAINEVNGHAVGDRVLKEIATRLKMKLGDKGIAGRMGGDEFAFILPNSANIDKKKIVKYATELCASLGNKIETGHASLTPSVSIGLSVFPNNASTIEQLIDCADFALYSSKQLQRGNARLFSTSDQALLQKQRNIEVALANANDDEFSLYYQPILDAKTELLTGFEALARWHSSELGLVSPGVFVPIAEKTGYINKITRLLLSKALNEATKWPSHLTLSFNLSSHDVNSLENAEKIKSIILASQFSSNRLIAEMTETAIIQDVSTTKEALGLLTDIGVAVALDDFGTGYSSINHLLDFDFERIKLDRVLIDSIESNKSKHEIVRALIDLCNNLQIECVIEGVEEEIQKLELSKMKVDKFQGYLFSKPLPVDQVSDYILQNS